MSSLTKDVAPAPSTICADDGTSLSYYVLGNGGSKLIIIPGAMSSALSQYELGTALAATHSVYLFSRRGRGLSGPYPSSISDKLKSSPLSSTESHTVYDAAFSSQVLHTDLQDLASLMRHTGATSLMGISSGSLLVLAALLPNPTISIPPITKAIIFDPPLFFPASIGTTNFTSSSTTTTTAKNSTVNLSLLRRYEQEISDNDIPSALVTAMYVSQMGPAWMSHVPRWILRPLTRKVMAWEAKAQAKKLVAAGGRQDEGAVTMEALAPVLRYDFALCEAVMALLLMVPGNDDEGELVEMVQQRRLDVDAVVGKRDVLLLGGELSMGYVRRALDVLEQLRANEGLERVEVPGVGHELFENTVRNGKVEKGFTVVEKFLQKRDAGV